LGQDRDDDRGLFGALALMNGRSVSRHQGIEFTEAIGDGSTVKTDGQFACVDVDIINGADVAVVDFLLVVVLDLHDFVARREGPAKSLDLAFAGRIERSLEFDVE
jgi:hypothetical protein